ncbi:MAG: hypothetical protein J7L88_05210, partial [Thermoplasmata archaeon]|nr:hypothetical protein [Thermoplasmata archaeon]
LEGGRGGERLFFQSTIFIFFLYLMVVLLGSVALIASGLGIRDGLFLTASALTNTGLDPGTIAGGVNSFTPVQKGLFMVIMVVGRLDVVIPIFLLSPSLKRFS